ncbi:hypothetical protein BCY86_03605 [Pajaroellobacter abortibovis]|uniref:Uncharacterized protein n=1 Tax=Pajaroellobacter abortibovis TaxID=1882918 RepID=A0A1L6MWF1_9BACT|nr:hypothetical protein BCY86_03605 [Pajaroellobacter abortibovis]
MSERDVADRAVSLISNHPILSFSAYSSHDYERLFHVVNENVFYSELPVSEQWAYSSLVVLQQYVRIHRSLC